ncbi:serine carboxypeptidase-like 34-like [Tripterygium wilfordii]|uniref:Serine carboxypeptidase-like 34-like n=1 Tax=Tripterygium wilfordii TaxID=458696 RepID=A0A7J7CV64_TRIWF|nr:serine carboxypeptidase-like 34 isoform X2 [Tripterygium wilfordii]KAF5738025.1 serine carboxypeptidase-like 34-like [Tripterygium wilfordii]
MRIGNGLLDDETDGRGVVDYLWSHAVISDRVHEEICQRILTSTICIVLSATLMTTIITYNIQQFKGKKSHRKTAGSKDDNPCVDYVTPYMNRPDAQKALHANVTKLPYPWQACGYHIQRWNVLPVIKRLIAGGGLRVLIYSGDADGMVPVTSTRYASRKLGLNITQDWTPWYGSNKQVGGWTTIYDGGLTFGTVRGAAHQVPASAPKRTLQIVGHFLADKKLPSVPF